MPDNTQPDEYKLQHPYPSIDPETRRQQREMEIEAQMKDPARYPQPPVMPRDKVKAAKKPRSRR